MYLPSHFKEQDESVLYAFMRAHPFATLVTSSSEGPIASHLPVYLDEQKEAKACRLLGHVARANSHWEHFASHEKSLLIFHGPHGYISPTWYQSDHLVPTWNYASVHVTGQIRVLEDPRDVRSVLNCLVDQFEKSRPEPWQNQLGSDVMKGLMHAIVAFEFHVQDIEGKFKLGQNRAPADQLASLEGLENETENTELIRLTRTRLKTKSSTAGKSAAPSSKP
ncbi:MAG: FMN-binding negative transcriptional regulator [Myxococcota bacterium]|nr:FMN-binding negative transcriptional regulator [Myxococcota bacterium]